MNISIDQNTLFSELVDEWWTNTSIFVKRSTLVKYSNLLNSYILPTWGDISLSQITNNKIKEFANDLLLFGGKDGSGLIYKKPPSDFSKGGLKPLILLAFSLRTCSAQKLPN